MLFRAPHPLTPEDLQRRAPLIRDWIDKVTSMGIALSPRNLVAASAENRQPADPALVTMVFFDAATWEQAEHVARLHPGPSYGTHLELREWRPPVPA
jgi:hypothetical protein